MSSMGAVPAASGGGGRSWIVPLLLAFATFAAYWPAVSNGFVWDDQYYVTENPHLGSWEGLRQIWLVRGAVPQYYPLVHTTMWIEFRLWGVDPAGYHVTNIVLHALNAILFWRVLERLRLPGAALAAGIFALHPVGVESVAWIAERKNVLSLFFYLAAMLAYFRFDAPESERPKDVTTWRWSAAFALFMLALLSKTVTFSLPAAIAVIFWWKRGRLSLRSAVSLVPFVVAGAVFGYQTAWMELEIVGARGASWELSAWERVLMGGRAVWFYATSLLWPVDLCFSYERWEIDGRSLRQIAYPVTAALVVLAAWLARGRIGRGPLAAILFFGGTLTPALGFFDIYPFFYSYVADHFQYHASLGLFALFGAALASAGRKLPKPLPTSAAVVLLATLGFLSWQQARVYESPTTLWLDVLDKNPTSRLAHNNLGVIYDRQGEHQRAIHHARQVLRHHPDDDIGHFNLANYLFRAGKLQAAERHYRKQLAIESGHIEARTNLADLLARQGRKQEAAREYVFAKKIQAQLQALLEEQSESPEPRSRRLE